MQESLPIGLDKCDDKPTSFLSAYPTFALYRDALKSYYSRNLTKRQLDSFSKIEEQEGRFYDSKLAIRDGREEGNKEFAEKFLQQNPDRAAYIDEWQMGFAKALPTSIEKMAAKKWAHVVSRAINETSEGSPTPHVLAAVKATFPNVDAFLERNPELETAREESERLSRKLRELEKRIHVHTERSRKNYLRLMDEQRTK